MCGKKQYRRHVGLCAFTPTSEPTTKTTAAVAAATTTHACTKHRPHRCERYFECRMCGKKQKPIQTACRSSRVYVNVGANNKNNSSSSNNSRMHETSATPMRKTLGASWSDGMSVFARLRQRRSQQQQPISTAQVARNTENARFSMMAAGKRSIHRHAGVSTDVGVSSGKLGLQFLLPNSAYSFVDLQGFPPMPASPAENWGSNFCYQILFMKCSIYMN